MAGGGAGTKPFGERPTVTEARGKRLFCFGYGFSAAALGALLAPAGWTLGGTCRTAEGSCALAGAGVDAVPFSREAPLAHPAQSLAGTTHLLLSIPPDAHGDPALDCHGADIAAIEGLEWIGYLSTTGVYGDTGGAWVDESAPLAPTGARGKRRLEAERGWLALGEDRGLAVQVFRLAGIYGPGRNALAAVKRGSAKRIAKSGQVFSAFTWPISRRCWPPPSPSPAPAPSITCAMTSLRLPPMSSRTPAPCWASPRRRSRPWKRIGPLTDGAELLFRQPAGLECPHQE